MTRAPRRPSRTAADAPTAREPLRTPDGRYIVVRGRLWRASDPSLPEPVRTQRVAELMHARRDVGTALRANDAAALRDARRRVHAAKIALGERGPVWWSDGAPALDRVLIASTPYAGWYARRSRRA